MFNEAGQIDHLTFAGMRGGGKGGGGSSDSSYLSETNLTDPNTGMVYTSTPLSTMMGSPSASAQLDAAILQDQSSAAAVSAANSIAAAASSAAAESTFQNKMGTAYSDAMQNAIQAFQGQGVDPNQYMSSYITPTLQRTYNSITDLNANPEGEYPTSLGQSIVNQALSDRRTQAMNQINSAFAPDYATTALPDTTSNAYVEQILGEQFDPLAQQLTNAQKRGTLTDVGYQAATDAMNAKKSAARSSLQSLGSNILSTDRSSINDLISGAKTDVSNLSLAQGFDPSSYTTRASNMAQSDIQNFGGALRNAVGGTQFADIQDLLNAGGSVQGATTGSPAGATPAAGTGAVGTGGGAPSPDDQAAQQKRGLGSTGAF